MRFHFSNFFNGVRVARTKVKLQRPESRNNIKAGKTRKLEDQKAEMTEKGRNDRNDTGMIPASIYWLKDAPCANSRRGPYLV